MTRPREQPKPSNLSPFRIWGDCMTPTLQEGDLVLCARLDTPETVVNGELYAVHCEHGYFVCRARKAYNTRGRVGALILCYDNTAHEPFDIETGPGTTIYRVVMVERDGKAIKP
jgi:signal peptidase I